MIYLLQTKHYALGFQGFPNLFIIYNIFVLYQEEYTVFNRIQPKITVGHMWDTFVAGYKGSLSYLLQTTRVPLHYALGFQCFQILFIIYNIFCIIPRRIYIKYYICYRLQGFPLALCFGFSNLFIIYNIFVLYQEEYTVFNRIQPKITVGHMWDTFVAGQRVYARQRHSMFVAVIEVFTFVKNAGVSTRTTRFSYCIY